MKFRLFAAVLSLSAGLLALIPAGAQPMLTYTDAQGDFYVSDSGRLVHLEHLRVRSVQHAANSLAYVNNVGDLIYYGGHKQKRLDVSNPTFYRNTDYYLYYGNGGSFSLFDGNERKYLGFIQNNPYCFGDSIAAMHDYAEFFYVYEAGQFMELEQQPVLTATAGDNILAYVNHIGQFRIYFHGEQMDIDSYGPIMIQAGANTVTFIDNYQFMKVFWNGQVYELMNLPQINCLSSTYSPNPYLSSYCNGPIVVDVQTELPVCKTGDDLVAYVDDIDDFYVFYKGIITALENQPPRQYEIIDNVLWYEDGNGFFKVFCNGELAVVETYMPKTIQADKDIVAYTDLDNRLKVHYKGKTQAVSQNIILQFDLNSTMVMYSEIPNKFKFQIIR